MERQELTIKPNEKIRIGELAKKLVSLSYEKVGITTPEKEGQFSSRGNLIDLWLERYKTPVRIDLIGEKIENLYLFNPITQSKIKNLKEVYIVPFGTTPKLAPTWTKKAKFPVGSGRYERLFLSEIEPGDLVVHIDYGIGRFVSVTGKNGAEKSQNLIVEYAKGDKLYVPVGQIERLTKYIGVPGYKPRLNNLGRVDGKELKRGCENQ